MRVDLFDFDLPEDRIALRPVSPRDSAKMLLVHPPEDITDRNVRDLPDLLRAGDILVFNNTRVIPSRLLGKTGEARVEITLHKRESDTRWWAFLKNARRARPGKRIEISADLAAEVIEKTEADGVLLDLHPAPGLSVRTALARAGQMPLPPYIASRRKVDQTDEIDYQTLYASREGAVAAPTAGLHFTPDLMARLKDRGIETAEITLHVGAGTFLPVKAQDTGDHKMHAEWGEITPETAARLNAIKKKGGRIVAVGTTSLRLLESATDENGIIQPFTSDTRIFITPGYQFRAVDILMTNFHLPKSTLFMLVCAFAGTETMKAAYAHAIETGYRFYSYGDSSLLFRSSY